MMKIYCILCSAFAASGVSRLNVVPPFIALLLGGCTLPVEGLWPPPAGAPTYTIHVSLDTWHAMIAFHQGELRAAGSQQRGRPVSDPSSPAFPHDWRAVSRHSLFEEWGYAERAWYLEGRQGIGGVLRALFWPTEGVVEVGYHDKVWADRTPQPPAELFTFHLSDEGFRRLRAHLQATIASYEPVATAGTSKFYPAVRSYHMFHTCHQYAAEALRVAGLPIAPFWALSRGAFAMQLRRAAGSAERRRAAVLWLSWYNSADAL